MREFELLYFFFLLLSRTLLQRFLLNSSSLQEMTVMPCLHLKHTAVAIFSGCQYPLNGITKHSVFAYSGSHDTDVPHNPVSVSFLLLVQYSYFWCSAI